MGATGIQDWQFRAVSDGAAVPSSVTAADGVGGVVCLQKIVVTGSMSELLAQDLAMWEDHQEYAAFSCQVIHNFRS